MAYTTRQEPLHSAIHGIGILFGLTCIPILINTAYRENNTPGLIGTIIYGICFLMVFTSSTLYHAFQHQKLKRRFEVLDHISIYFLIAGTYTPFVLIYLNNAFGMTLLIILWVLAAIGTIFKCFFCGRWEIVSTLVYLAMGWILVVDSQSFFGNMSWSVIALIIAGGGLYSIGVVFYIWNKYKYNHAIWHFFVLAAAVCHYAAIALSV
jgi:hemolysin III